MTLNKKKLFLKPAWLEQPEKKIASKLLRFPSLLSTIKLFIITPLIFFAFKGAKGFPVASAWIFFLMFSFCLLDYLDGLVTKELETKSHLRRVYDRIADYPLLIIISLQCFDIIPSALILAKLALDSLLLIQFIIKTGRKDNKLRTTISYTALVALLFISQGWGARFVTTQMVSAIILLDIAFNVIGSLYNARIFQLRFIADALSGVNLTCGLISIWFSYHNALEISLLFLILGGIFDGFDGAAARKWGGTKWGVYSDDVADGVNYGIAPAFAMFFTLQGFEGCIVGGLYGIFTISRLIYFTLNKDGGDPNFFSGVPSPVGGLIAMCSLVLFREQQVLLGLFIGMSCIQMVSFDVQHRHLGRAFASKQKKYIIGLPLYAILIVISSFVWGVHFSTFLLLVVGLVYGLSPSIMHLKNAFIKIDTKA